MHKVDCNINTWVASYIKEEFDWISDATADCEENYGVDDIVFTAVTKSGDYIVKPLELKTSKGFFYQFKPEGVWNDYFSTDNPDGITKHMMFGNTPPPNMDILDVPYRWEPASFTPEYTEMPEHWKGKHIYILNAEDKYHRVHNSKAYKITDKHACLCYVAMDGLIFFNPTKLRKAFLGYAWFRVNSHTKEFGEKHCPTWELKAVYCLDEGSYHPANPPQEFFLKNKTNNYTNKY